MAERPLRIFSWNVNGIRAVERKGFLDWVRRARPDVLGVQEVRASLEQVPPSLHNLRGFRSHFVAAQRKGYSGVGLWVRHSSRSELPVPRVTALSLDSLPGVNRGSFDQEGRLQILYWGKLRIINGYFPNGNGEKRDNSRVPFKLEFYRRLRQLLLADVNNGAPILVMGDWNTAHRPIDLARPQENRTTSGFLPEECAALDTWFASGWIDTFRHLHPVPDPFALPRRGGRERPPGSGDYTWWSQRVGVREKNIGWRIDYVLASPGAMPYLRSARIHPEVLGSDHCPISVTLDRAVLGK